MVDWAWGESCRLIDTFSIPSFSTCASANPPCRQHVTIFSRVGPEGLSTLHRNSYCILRENLRLVMITELSTAGGIGLNRLNCSGPTGFQEEYRTRQSAAPFPANRCPRSNAWLALPNLDSTQIFHKS